MNRYSKEEGNQIANTILKQLGGRVTAMIGASMISASENSDEEIVLVVKFKAKGRNNGKACNVFKITSTVLDTYTVEVGYIRAMKYTERQVIEDVYCDELKTTVEQAIGLYLTL